MVREITHSTFAIWLVRRRYVKNKKVATNVLVAASICMLLLSAYVALLPSQIKPHAKLTDRYGSLSQTHLIQQ